MNKKNIRIKDIAELAGVSVGTVDRVLHKRGKVSQEALEKVMNALHQIEYKPNLLARTLGSKKTYKIAALIPAPSVDEYWDQSRFGIEKAAEDWEQYGVSVEIFFFDLYDKNSFKEVAATVSDSKPDGILAAPIFYQEALPFFKSCKSNNIPYVFFNTNIPEVEPLSFIGQNLYQSGKLGAELMYMGQQGPGFFAILHIYEDIHNSVHLLEKEKGFRKYFEENDNKNFEIKTFDLSSPKNSSVNKEIETLFSDPKLKGALVTTSKGVVTVSSFLEKHGKNSVRLVGYDLLEENLHYLKSGIIDFLINQNPKRQAFLGISHLANHLLFQKQPPLMDLFPLEIITRQNLESYLGSGIH